MNLTKHLQDITILKNMFFYRLKISIKLLKYTLETIFLIDFRLNIDFIRAPVLRIYSGLNSLVSKKIIKILDEKQPKNNTVIREKTAHTVFISHKNELFLYY